MIKSTQIYQHPWRITRNLKTTWKKPHMKRRFLFQTFVCWVPCWFSGVDGFFILERNYLFVDDHFGYLMFNFHTVSRWYLMIKKASLVMTYFLGNPNIPLGHTPSPFTPNESNFFINCCLGVSGLFQEYVGNCDNFLSKFPDIGYNGCMYIYIYR